MPWMISLFLLKAFYSCVQSLKVLGVWKEEVFFYIDVGLFFASCQPLSSTGVVID